MIKAFFSNLFIFSICVSIVFSQNTAHSNSQIHKVLVQEVLQTTSYTYLRVLEDEAETWLAVPKMEANADDIFYYYGGIEMRNFKSKELDTSFFSIMFLESVFDEKVIQHDENQQKATSVKTEKTEIKPVEGGITIVELLANPINYANKKVVLKGKVTKFSSNIMGMNWIHIDDGSNLEGESNITITSDEITEVGEIIVIEGDIVLDKDFGYGYFYKVLMEKGKIVTTSSDL